MKIVITGAAGAVGSHVAEALLKEGHLVRGIDSFSPYYSRALKQITADDITKKGVQFIEADLLTADLDYLLNETDVIYHFAAQPGLSSTVPFSDYLQNNVVATHRLLEAAHRRKVKLFVYISTSSVYGKQASGDETTLPKPTSFYGVTKLAGEELALSYSREGKVPATSLRLFSVYGERERPEKLYHKLIRSIERGEEFPLYEGSEKHVRSYTYVGDAVQGCLTVLKHQDKVIGEVFNIGSDKTITTGEGIAIVERLMGKKAKIVYKPARQGDQLETSANIEKAKRVLGYAPTTPPEEGLAREIAWYRVKIRPHEPAL